jgi:transposase
VLYRRLEVLGLGCDVIAPSSIPRRSGDRAGNDRIDAEKLAAYYASGLLTPVDVPDQELESARALLRCREALVEELTRTKNRTTQFLLTRGLAFREGTNWSQKHRQWLATIQRDRLLCEHDLVVLETYLQLVEYLEAQIRSLEERIEEQAEAPRFREVVRVLLAFRGIATITALTLAAELGDIRRFAHPRQLMGYLGLVPGERTSAEKTVRTSITKAGNTHARKAIVSAAWRYAARPTCSHALKQRQRLLPPRLAPQVIATSWKAQQRLHKRFHALAFRKERSVAAVAVARELAGFLWEAIARITPERAGAQAA